MQSAPIGSGGSALWCKPLEINGLNIRHRIGADPSAACINDDKFVVRIHGLPDEIVSALRVRLGPHIKQRELELIPFSERTDLVADSIIILTRRHQVISDEKIIGHGLGSLAVPNERKAS